MSMPDIRAKYITRDDSRWARSQTIFAGVCELMADSGVYAKLGTVLVKGEYRSFIALATNDPRDGLMNVPPSEEWADLKTILGREREPRWHHYV